MTGPLTALRRWRTRRVCQAAHDKMQEIVDGEVPSRRERERLTAHLDLCLPCGADASQIRELKEAIARVGSAPDPQVKARLEELCDQLRKGECDLEGA